MGRIKSAYEIAMEKADQLDEKGEEAGLEKRERLKPLMARFFKEKINAEKLWQELKGEERGLLREAQVLVLESLGLRTSSEGFEKRKQAVLAIESLKEIQKSSLIEQALEQLNMLKQQYSEDREQFEEQVKDIRERNSDVKMKPVKTKDGRTVMQLQSDIDEDTMRQFSQKLTQLEKMYTDKFNQAIEALKAELE